MSGSFENLEVWKRSRVLAVEVCRANRDCRDWGLRAQITRAAVSVPSNVAEGAERNTGPEFIQFLGYARGSLAELQTQLMIAADLEYLAEAHVNQMIAEIRQISKMLFGLIRSQKPDIKPRTAAPLRAKHT